MLRKWITKAPELLFLAVIVITTIFFGWIKSDQNSAYGECRKVVASREDYEILKYMHTVQRVFRSQVIFNDGYNYLICGAIGIGPFWIVDDVSESPVICNSSYGSVENGYCPRDYFGVSP